ncbi:MAG TPA: hypothetical protein VJJ25_02460 [Nitrosopumilaceae archaeon]|nr:hypothetical protein [Nitrosopumilaceae archaeon]
MTLVLVERSWAERTLEKLKLIALMTPFFIVSTYLVFFVDGGMEGIIAGMILLILSIFVVIPLGLMFGVNLDYYKEIETQ